MLTYLLVAVLHGVQVGPPQHAFVAAPIETSPTFDYDCNTCVKHISCVSEAHLIVAVSSEEAWQTNDPEEACHAGWCVGQHSLCIPEDDDAIEEAILTDDTEKLAAALRGYARGFIVDAALGVLQLRDCSGKVGAQYMITAKQGARLAAMPGDR